MELVYVPLCGENFMRVQKLNAIVKIAKIAAVGAMLIPSLTMGQQQQPQRVRGGSAPAHLSLADVNQFVVGGDIKWDVSPNGEGRRLQPSGLISRSCISDGNERAQMRLQPYPGKSDQMVLFISLTNACQRRVGPRITAAEQTPDFTSEDHLDETVELSSLFNGLNIPADFTGNIVVCALPQGDQSNLARRLEGNCSDPLALNGSAPGIVEGTQVIGALTRAERAAAAIRERDRLAAQERADQNRANALQAMVSLARAQCDGDLQRANRAIAQLASFGANSRELSQRVLSSSIEAWRTELRSARSTEDLDAIFERFQRAEPAIRDQRMKTAFRNQLFDRYKDLISTQIADLERIDGADARALEARIREFRSQAREIIGTGRESRERLASVEQLHESLTNRALALGSPARARELARAGADRTTGEQRIRYVTAERRTLEREYQGCVRRYSERDSSGNGLQRCERTLTQARSVQRNLQNLADESGNEEIRERVRDDGQELFGRPSGYVQTAFGPVYQQGSTGEMQAFYQRTVYEVMMEQMQMQGMGGMNMLGMQSNMNPFALQMMMGGQQFGGGARFLSAGSAGGFPNQFSQNGFGARAPFGMM